MCIRDRHTTSVYSNARIKRIDTDRIMNELEQRKIVIVTGFQGVDQFDNYTCLLYTSSAAIYAQRAMLDFVMIEKEYMPGGQVVQTYEVDNLSLIHI